jgi:predicted O-methyltransferase YrrM
MQPFQRKAMVAAVVVSALFLGVSVAAVELAGRFAMPIMVAGALGGVLVALLLLYGRLEDRVDEARGLIEAAFALYHELRPVAPLPLGNSYAVASDSALLLAKLVRESAPEVVVETGSGVSTLVITYELKALGKGKLISLELDEEHARRTREEVARHGLTEWVTVVHAPLREVVVDGATYRWHDLHALDDVPAIDLVFDDGPPRYLGPSLRYAAMPLLAPKLRPHAIYCMNFVSDEERKTIARWMQRDPHLHAEWHRTKKGNVVLRHDNHA